MSKTKNIMKDILDYYLKRTLTLRFDICTCEKCRSEMINYLLAKFPLVYVEEDSPDYRKVEKEVTAKYLKEIFEEINNAISRVGSNLPHPVEEDKNKAFENLLEMVKIHRGVDFSRYRRELLKRRIAVRMLANQVESYSGYLKVLAGNPQEYEKLFENLTINVSEFFRDSCVWEIIGDILGEVIQRNNEKYEPVVLWSSACAKGEEPYSLAMLAAEINNLRVPFKIYATDIDDESLNRAKAGVYDKSVFEKAIANLPNGKFSCGIDKYFIAENGKYRIKDQIKKMIEFQYLDLTSQNYLKNVDIILCRNAFIYFTKPLQEQIVDNFYKSLKDGGYLITGETEVLIQEARSVFEQTTSYKTYKKIK